MKAFCRACGATLPEEELLSYSNMPKSAQFFPTERTVAEERGADIVLKECPWCGLVQTAGEPVPYYRDVIRAAGVSEEMRRFRLEQFQDWVERRGLIGREIIEIGCGSGEYMRLMEAAGAEVYGLEHRRSSVAAGRTAGRRIFEGFVEDAETAIPRAPYDGFFCLNFLEHIPRPGAFLRGIFANLAEGARGLVEVPNFDMMLQKSLYSEFIQDHLSYFTKDTLANLLWQNGFEVLRVSEIWYGYILSAEVVKRRPTRVEGFLEKRAALRSEVADFLRTREDAGKRVAVWGAGHQALANLSLLDMAGRIAYVVDSAEFKQGKYTPATHILIVPPAELKKGAVQTVIIMAAGYSREVREIMERDYPEIEVVILTEEGIEG